MDNQKQKKNPNKHLIISLSIIGVALVVAVIIAVFAVVGNLNNEINGKNPKEIYGDLVSSVYATDNYKVVIKRAGNGSIMSGDSIFYAADIELEEEIRVDGEDLYYKRVQKIEENGKLKTSVWEITVADGIGYTFIQNGDSEPQKLKTEVATQQYNPAAGTIESLIWNYADLFEDVQFKESNGIYTAEMNKDNSGDPKFAKALSANACAFFESTVAALVNGSPKDFENFDYIVTYNSQGRPVTLDYEYDMGNNDFFAGELRVEADFEYGSVKIEAPSDADSYQ